MFPTTRPLAERFGVEFFRQIPERPGVYLLCGPDAGVLYVGKARNLRQRLGHYRSASLDFSPRKLQRLVSSVERILWDECPDEAAALERERELLLALQPRFNRAGVRPPRPTWFSWRPDPTGLVLACGTPLPGWGKSPHPLPSARWVQPVLWRILWWLAHPDGTWCEMPANLRGARLMESWQLPCPTALALELAHGLEALFSGQSPELLEWVLGAAAQRPSFERAWIQKDALWLLECFDQLQKESTPEVENA